MTHTYYTCQLESGMIVRCRILGLDFNLKVMGWESDKRDSSLCHVSLKDQLGNEYELMVRTDFDWEVLPDGEFVPIRIYF